MIEKIDDKKYILSGYVTPEEKFKMMKEMYGEPKRKEAKTYTFGEFNKKTHEESENV